MADLGINPNEPIYLQRTGCPIIVEDATYLFPGDTVVFDLDTINGVRYTLMNKSDNFGVTTVSADELLYAASDLVEAGLDVISLRRTIIGDSVEVDIDYEIFVRRAGQTLMMNQAILDLEDRGEYCVDPISNLPGEILCNEIIFTAENYGGQGLQNVYFRSRNADEHCFIYHSTRFAGNDTIGIILCDEFSICDTFLQPLSIVGDTLTLPFFDDFTNDGPYPSKSKWSEDLTYVNNTMAVNPPSFGAATFDGLNQKGRPYGGEFGVADRLTSKPIDLSNSSVGQNVALSFYYQMKGRGFFTRKQDSLIVEFLTEFDGWKKVAAFEGSGFIRNNVFPPFVFHGIELDDPAYFHSGFQFRFSNLSERSGAYGVWHLDYVALNNTTSISNFDPKDLTIIEGNGSLLKKYTSVPIQQLINFEDKEIDDQIYGAYQNFNNTTAAFNTDNIFITNLNSGETYDVLPAGIGGNNDPFKITFDNTPIFGGTLNEIKEDIRSVLSQDEIRFEVLQTISGSDEKNSKKNNDSLRTETIISNYFAYDDGTAEKALDSDGANSMVAVEFEANVEDSLKAIQFHFPEVNGDYYGQRFNILVWEGSLGTAGQAKYLRTVRPAPSDSIQGFTTYIIADPNIVDSIVAKPISISPGKFYVGWQQLESTPNPIPVGFDRNTPEASQHISFHTGFEWRKLDDYIDFKGALMIRPVMDGAEEPLQTSTKDTQISSQEITVYPNPVTDQLNFKIENGEHSDYEINIFNNLGQSFYSGKLTRQIDTQQFMAGIYFAKVINRKTFETQFVQFVKQ